MTETGKGKKFCDSGKCAVFAEGIFLESLCAEVTRHDQLILYNRVQNS